MVRRKVRRRLWLLFTKDGKYRVAQFEDLKFPDAARKLQGTNLEKASKYPYVGGYINRDGADNDFAAIVVDTMRPDRNRFGLVIFSQPKDVSGQYSAYLLISGRALSKTLLEWWSGGLQYGSIMMMVLMTTAW